MRNLESIKMQIERTTKESMDSEKKLASEVTCTLFYFCLYCNLLSDLFLYLNRFSFQIFLLIIAYVIVSEGWLGRMKALPFIALGAVLLTVPQV